LATKARSFSPPALQFGNAGEQISLGGATLDYDLYMQAGRKWRDQILQLTDQYDNQRLQDRYPPFFKETLNMFGLVDSLGHPPSLRLRGSQIEGAVGHRKPTTTHGLLAAIALDVLKQLPDAASLEEGSAQLVATIDVINDKAQKQTIKLESANRVSHDKHAVTGGIAPGGIAIKPLENQLYSAVQTGHFVFVAKNGAIQILKLPTPKEMAEIIKHDPEAQRQILLKQPLNHVPSYPPKHFRDIPELLRFLGELEEGKYPQRVHPSGATDIHHILTDIQFDYPKHIREGRLKTLLDKPGADRRKVWEVVDIYKATA
jgi:hypothetical protein